MTESQSHKPSRGSLHFPSIILGFFIGSLLVCIVSALFLAQAMSGIAMGSAMASPKNVVVLDSLPSPTGEAIAYAIDDGCGATCGCATRVDISLGERYFREVYRTYEMCDLRLTWASPSLLQISDSNIESPPVATINITKLDGPSP